MNLAKQILVVEDDPTSLEAVSGYYEVEGYRVVRARDADEMERALKRHVIDLIVLDIRLPGKDGLTLLRELRTHSDVPVIVTSARTEDVDHIVALEIGADDYLDKPINLRELLVRTKNILRRMAMPATPPQETDELQKFNGWTLDRAARTLTKASGEDVHLTRGEFDLLSFMAQRPGRVLQRDQLLDCLAGREWQPFDRTIDVLIGRLRNKIESDPKTPAIVITVHGVGYVFMGKAELAS
ncbi:response regulator [Aliiroseovarius crassostreae]|uniref:response regulator n=1 Tax=Aliiroseovarius crassostreae TaxID=154981 RepID=UPI003C7B5566